jgi:hypothetical protein
MEQALRRAPNCVEVHYDLGVAFQNPGDAEKALTPFRQIIAPDQHCTKAWRAIRKRNCRVLHITGKLPTNFLNLGLTKILFPNARVMHANAMLVTHVFRSIGTFSLREGIITPVTSKSWGISSICTQI